MTRLIRTFAADYWVSNSLEPERAVEPFEFSVEGARFSPALELFVQPVLGKPWRGAFFGEFDELSVAAHSPNPNKLVVVARGSAYVVPVETPANYEAVAFPVRSIQAAIEANTLLLVGYCDLVGLGPSGRPAWNASDLVSDGFNEVRVSQSVVVVRGYFAPEDRDVEITVDLVNGEVLDRR